MNWDKNSFIYLLNESTIQTILFILHFMLFGKWIEFVSWAYKSKEAYRAIKSMEKNLIILNSQLKTSFSSTDLNALNENAAIVLM